MQTHRGAGHVGSPRCGSGNGDQLADFAVRLAGRNEHARVANEVAPDGEFELESAEAPPHERALGLDVVRTYAPRLS